MSPLNIRIIIGMLALLLWAIGSACHRNQPLAETEPTRATAAEQPVLVAPPVLETLPLSVMLPSPAHLVLDRPIRLQPAVNELESRDIERMHSRYRRHFVEAANYGFSRVVSFPPASQTIVQHDGRSFQAYQVQLIGLLKEELPRMYEGVMPEVRGRQPKTRALSVEENRLLTRLQRGKDLSWSSAPSARDGLVVLGALRAGESCIECHDVASGELLGALAYELKPTPDDHVQIASAPNLE